MTYDLGRLRRGAVAWRQLADEAAALSDVLAKLPPDDVPDALGRDGREALEVSNSVLTASPAKGLLALAGMTRDARERLEHATLPLPSVNPEDIDRGQEQDQETAGQGQGPLRFSIRGPGAQEGEE
jgi:hypothetical protein